MEWNVLGFIVMIEIYGDELEEVEYFVNGFYCCD